MKKGEEMWKTELETLKAIASKGKSGVKITELSALFPDLLPRSVYYRVERLVLHGLIHKKKVDNRWIVLSITPEGAVMLK